MGEQVKQLTDFLFRRSTPVKFKVSADTFKRYGLPLKYHGLTLASWVAEGGAEEDAAEIKAWADNIISIRDRGEMVGLVLGGPHGTGKTGLAVFLAQVYLAKTFQESKQGGRVGAESTNPAYDYERPLDFQVRFVDMTDLATMIASADSFNQRDHQERWAELNEVGFLIIDDISQKLLEGEDSVYLMRLIKNRLMNKKLTILTTNMPKDSLQNLVGLGGRSVLREGCYLMGIKRSVIRRDNTEGRKPWAT